MPERQPDHLQRQPARAAVGEQREQRGAALLVVGVPAGERRLAGPAVGGLGVEDDRLRHHDGAVAGARRPPAEVQVVAEHRQLVVEPADRVEDPAPHQHPGRVDREDRPHLGVLPLVVLAALQPGLAPAGPGDGHAELEHRLQRRPLAQHRPEDVGLGVLRGAGEQGQQRLGVRAGVVVQQPDPLRSIRRAPSSSSRSRPRRTAAGYVVDDGAATTWSAPKASSSSARLSSLLPVSTATRQAIGASCSASPASTVGSHRSPSWLTSRTATSSAHRLARGPRGAVAGRRGGGVGHGRPQ